MKSQISVVYPVSQNNTVSICISLDALVVDIIVTSSEAVAIAILQDRTIDNGNRRGWQANVPQNYGLSRSFSS